jgi:ABC-type Fe3+-hydroxamate transport system substrate-binding protein
VISAVRQRECTRLSTSPAASRVSRAVIGAIALGAIACATPSSDHTAAGAPAALVDDFGDTLHLARAAQRVVSLNPVTTEAMFALGAGDRLVGRTHFDGTPAAVKQVTDVGNGLQPNVEAVLTVRPDLVVLYAAEGNRAAAAALRRAGVQTLTLRTDRIADLARALHALAVAVGDSAAAQPVVDSVRHSLDASRATPTHPATVFFHVWDAPVITIGGGSYLDELATLVGARNVFGDLPQPSPQVTMESVAQRNPDFVLASPNAASRLKTDPRWRAVPAVRDGRVLVIDTALVGRPGVRMGEAARSLRALLDSATRRTP